MRARAEDRWTVVKGGVWWFSQAPDVKQPGKAGDNFPLFCSLANQQRLVEPVWCCTAIQPVPALARRALTILGLAEETTSMLNMTPNSRADATGAGAFKCCAGRRANSGLYFLSHRARGNLWMLWVQALQGKGRKVKLAQEAWSTAGGGAVKSLQGQSTDKRSTGGRLGRDWHRHRFWLGPIDYPVHMQARGNNSHIPR